MNKLIYVIFLSLIIACSSKENHYNVIQPTKEKTIDASKFVESIDYVKLEVKDSNFLGKISNVIFKNNCYYIVDDVTNFINVFSHSGRFLFYINSVGFGPGEYTNITDIYVDNYIHVLCRSQKKIVRFDLNGNALDERRINIYIEGIRPLKDGTYLTYSGSGGVISKSGRKAGIGKLKFLKNNSKYDILNSFGGNYAAYNIPHRQYFSDSERDSYLLLNGTDKIYSYKEQELSVKYLLDFGDIAIPEKYKTLENNIENMQLLQQKKFVLFKDYLIENSSFVFLSFLQGNINKMNHLFYNKITGKAMYSSLLNNDINPLKPYSFPRFKKGNEELISILNTSIFEEYYDLIKSNKEEIIANKGESYFYELDHFYIDLINSEQPILAIAKIKNNIQK